MNYKILMLAFFGFTVILLFGQQNVSLSIEIEGFSNKKGFIRVAVFNKESTFLKTSEYTCIQPLSKTSTCLFDIPKGQYGVAVFHDENGNTILDKNGLGIPIEAYGFSNGVRPRFRSPRFKEALFDLNESKTIKIKIKKWF